MRGPCMCGDTACGFCHPEGQTSMLCTMCSWRGKLCDTDDERCPQCNSEIVSDEQRDAGFDAFCQEENEL